MDIPEGFELVSDVPEGFELVEEETIEQPETQAAVEPEIQEKPQISSFQKGLARVLGLPVDAITAALNLAGADIQNPVGGRKSLEEIWPDIQGASEAVTTVATGAVAEPVAGLAGIAQTINPMADEGAGERAVESTRDLLTIQPQSDKGKENVQAIGETLEPVADAFKAAEDWSGDAVFEATGSPALASMAKSFPTFATEVLGFTLGKGAIKTGKAAKDAKVISTIAESAPSVEQLKATSSAIYKELDDAGASIKPESFANLVDDVTKMAAKEGLDKDLTPGSSRVLERLAESLDSELSLTDIDTLRQVAKNAVGAPNPKDARLANKIIDGIDDYLDGLSESDLATKVDNAAEFGPKYKAARELWGRAKRSEMIGEAFDKARLQASGFENGIRIQFRQILANKKKSKFFNPEERAAMRRVVEGTKTENLAKLVGRLGFSEGNATNIIGGALGVGAGATIGGPVGAVAVPLIGQLSRKLAQRLTAKNANFADQVIRSGNDAKQITKAYLKNTPANLRNPQELSELLMRTGIDLSEPLDIKIAREAFEIAQERRAALAAGATAGALAPTQAAAED